MNAHCDPTPQVSKPSDSAQSVEAKPIQKPQESAKHKEPVTLTRAELYDAVWRQSMCTLAAEYGPSDVGLGG